MILATSKLNTKNVKILQKGRVKMFQKTKNFVKTQAKKMEKAVAPMLMVGAAIGLMPTVYADPTGTLDSTLGKIVDMVLSIFRYIGIILALWGVGSLVMAFKNEDADSKSRAIMSLVVGVILMFLKTFVEPILKAAGFSI